MSSSNILASREQARQYLRQTLAQNADFRDGQWEAIDALVNHRSKILVVQRTGWGKSSVYFIATRLLRSRGYGPTLIVSPLLALMRNQIDAARRLGLTAVSINSTNTSQWASINQSVLRDEVDVLLVSPERFANDEFVENVLLPIGNRLGLLVVDEAHCISDWGHDFRPDYRRIVNILRYVPPNMPILGTTATANNRVLRDIRAQLGNFQIQRGPLIRETLGLQTIRLPDQASRLAWLAEHVPHISGTGIIYILTKHDAEQVTAWLNQNDIPAKAYYSDVQSPGFQDTDSYRQHLEDLLLCNSIKVLVATTALGMGYDKPDLSFVIHYQAPGSIISYYQQVGRAGRAIPYAFGILLSGKEDQDIQDFFRRRAFPTDDQVQSILEALADSDGLTEREIEMRVNIRHSQITQAIKFMSVEQPAPLIKDGNKWLRTPVRYTLNHEHIERLTHQRALEWQEVQEYITSRICLMAFLARSLDDDAIRPCGKCAVCLGRSIIPETVPDATVIQAQRYLRQAEMPLVCKKQVAAGAFRVYGFRGNLPAELRAETGRILSRWGDAGWGRMVAEDKRAGRFRDELVDAVVAMIQLRWKPYPRPTWVTCVPSLLHPTLVPDFARRVAAALKLPFVSGVTKQYQNQAQKLQENRYHQCINLDGVFSIRSNTPTGPVLLLDDIVDSAWTLTVVSALLRQRGISAVWPVALATTSSGE